MLDPESQHRSAEEMAVALRALSKEDIRLLLAMAAKCSYRLPLEPGDLMHMAFEKALSCSRECPTHVPVMAYLINAIRGIAENERVRKQNQCVSLDENEESGQESLINQIPCPAPTPEEVLVQRDTLQRQKRVLLELIADDRDAQMFIQAHVQGWSNEQIMSNLGFDSRKVEAIQTKIRRRVSAARKGESR